jgi:hypothetical protein
MLTAATRKLFNEVNCTAKEGWKQQIYHSVPSNWDNPSVQTVTCFKAPGNVWEKYALSKAVVQGKDLSNVQAVGGAGGPYHRDVVEVLQQQHWTGVIPA